MPDLEILHAHALTSHASGVWLTSLWRHQQWRYRRSKEFANAAFVSRPIAPKLCTWRYALHKLCCNCVVVMSQRRCRQQAKLFDGHFLTLVNRTATRLVCVAKEWRHKRAEPTSRCRDIIESAAATPKLQMPAAREPSALWPPFLVWRHNRSRVVSCPIYVAASQKTSRWSDRTRFGPPSARLTRFLCSFFAKRRCGPAPRACRVSLSWRCRTTNYR